MLRGQDAVPTSLGASQSPSPNQLTGLCGAFVTLSSRAAKEKLGAQRGPRICQCHEHGNGDHMRPCCRASSSFVGLSLPLLSPHTIAAVPGPTDSV